MAKTISQRITLEGSDDIKKKFEELGKAGEKSFKQIQDAAEKTKVDPARVNEAKQAFDNLGAAGSKLGSQLGALANSLLDFGSKGTKSFTDVATAAAGTAQAAAQVGTAVAQTSQQVVASGESTSRALISAANAYRIAAVGIAAAIGAIVSALIKGAGETAKEITGQADKLKLSTAEWVKLRAAIAGAGGSFDDFVKGAGKTVDLIAKMKEEIAKVSTTFKVMGADGKLIDATVTTMSQLTKETAAAVTAFRALGVSMKTLQSGDTMAILAETAKIIDRMPDGLKKTAAGVQFFGDSWKDVIKTLLAGMTATVDSQEALRKKSRELTADQIDNSKKAAEAWADLGKAIRATKDLIGAFFAPGSAARAEWLTSLVDGSRELLRTWLSLGAAGRVAFLENLGGSAVESAFKVLIAVGQQLAGIWTDVLVPAGKQVMGVVQQLAGSFGVTWEQVAAGLITVAIAATAFAIAFKGIAFVLSPFTALIGLFISFGPILIPLIALVVLFWDQIKAGAQSLAALLPLTIEKLKRAFGALVQGDFAGAWKLFSEAAVEAFETIKLKVIQTFNDIRRNGEGVFADLIRLIAGDQIKTPWLKEFVDGIKQVGVELPATLAAIVIALVAVRRAAVAVAPIVSRMFGAEVSGTGVVLLGIIGQMSGAFQVLASLATIVAASFTTLGVIIAVVGTVFGTTAAAVVGLVALIPILGALIFVFWDNIIAGLAKVGRVTGTIIATIARVIEAWVTTPVANAWQWIVDTFNLVIAALGSAISAAYSSVVSFVTTPVANAWQWMVDSFDAAIEQIKAKSSILLAILKAIAAPGVGIPALIDAIGGKAAGGAIPGNASGGLLGGRGTGTSDSNLAWVSRGEHIMPARAVAQPGVLAFLEALRRSGGNLRDVLDGMGRFALGGMVRAPISIPAFAGGGGTNNVTIQFPGLPEITGLRASSGVVDELRKAAALAQVRSGGRKPSRYS
jgi:hypothetical protein